MTAHRNELVSLSKCLRSADEQASRNAAYRIKDLVLASNPAQRDNQDLIADVDGVIDGLVNLVRRGSPEGKYYSCYAMAQLAWSHPRNSLLIPSTPGALDALSSLLDSGVDAWGAREYAAIIIGNCGANSEEGAELIVKHSGVLSSLITCLLNSREVRMQETIVVAVKNCAASSQEAAFVVAQSDKALALLKKLALQDIQPRLQYVAIGAINSISRSPRAVPRLRRMGFHTDVLFKLLRSRKSDADSDLRALTVACAVVNIEAYAEGEPGDPAQSGDMIRKWVFGQDGQQAVSSMVKCLGFALRGEQWNNLDADRVVSYLTQLIRECQRFSHWKHNMDVAIKILEYLAITPAYQALVRGQCMKILMAIATADPPQSVWFPPHPSPEDLVVMRKIKVQAKKMSKTLLVLPIAVCMGHHARLGQQSFLMGLDDALLHIIVVSALYEGHTSHE